MAKVTDLFVDLKVKVDRVAEARAEAENWRIVEVLLLVESASTNAVRVRSSGKMLWLPRSQLHRGDGMSVRPDDVVQSVYMPAWLAVDRGLEFRETTVAQARDSKLGRTKYMCRQCGWNAMAYGGPPQCTCPQTAVVPAPLPQDDNRFFKGQSAKRGKLGCKVCFAPVGVACTESCDGDLLPDEEVELHPLAVRPQGWTKVGRWWRCENCLAETLYDVALSVAHKHGKGKCGVYPSGRARSSGLCGHLECRNDILCHKEEERQCGHRDCGFKCTRLGETEGDLLRKAEELKRLALRTAHDLAERGMGIARSSTLYAKPQPDHAKWVADEDLLCDEVQR